MAILTVSNRFRPKIQFEQLRSTIQKQAHTAALTLAGMVVGILGFTLFQQPSSISWGGAGAISLMLNHYLGLTFRTGYWLVALPMLMLGFFTLGRWQFVAKSIFLVIVWGPLTDLAINFFATTGITPISTNILLNAIFGGILGGISGGLLYSAGVVFPGTGVLSRTIQLKTGLPIGTVYLMIDGIVLFLMGLTFGWENGLVGALMLIIGGQVTDYVMEGPSTARTVSVVTNRPQKVANALMSALEKGVSYWEVTGGYSGEKHYMVTSTIMRSQMGQVKAVVHSADPDAFVTIGMTHKALGAGFVPLQ